MLSERRKGFTLIELMVVIGVIILVVGMSLPVISAMRLGKGMKGAGSNLQGMMIKIKGFAASDRNWYRLKLYLDADENGLVEIEQRYNVNSTTFGWRKVDEPYRLPAGVQWSKDWMQSDLAHNYPEFMYIYVKPDGTSYCEVVKGTIKLQPDVSVSKLFDNTPKADIILQDGSDERYYIDLNPNTCKLHFRLAP